MRRLFTVETLLGSLLVFILVSAFILFKNVFSTLPDQAFYLAVVGPLSGGQNIEKPEMFKGIQLYIDRVNQTGGVNGKPVKLIFFDDQGNTELARKKAVDIIEQNQALLVLGHFYSSTSIAGGEVYKKFKIPVITASATADSVTKDNPWYFRVIYNNHLQGTFLAYYAKNILNNHTVQIINHENVFGQSLAKHFEEEFIRLGGKVEHRWSFNSNDGHLEQTLEKITHELAQDRAPHAIFLGVFSREMEKIIVPIRRKGLKNNIFVTDINSQVFHHYAEEQKNPGFFLDNVYSSSPIIFDVAGEKAQQFRNAYMARYQEEPNWIAASYYDAAILAVEALRTTQVQGSSETITTDRENLRTYLASLRSMDKAVEGVTGWMYFDEQGDAIKPVTVGTFKQQHLISALTQLLPVTDLNRVKDLEQEMAKGNIFSVNGQYLHKTDIVYTGIDLNEVGELDIKSSSYMADFYLWFRYQGQSNNEEIEFLNAFSPVQLGKPINEEMKDNEIYRAYRIKTKFKAKFDFHDYPFDKQKLVLAFRHVNKTRENVIYVVDILGLRYQNDTELLEKLKRIGAFSTITDWQIGRVGLFQDIEYTESTLGHPLFLKSAFNKIEYSRFNTVLSLKRDTLSFTVKNLLPLFIVVMLSYLVFFIPHHDLPTRLSVNINALLTVAFFHLKLSNDLPPGLGYLIALDYAFYALYLLIVFGIGVALLTYLLVEREKTLLLTRISLSTRILHPIIVFVIIGWFVYRYA